MANRLTILLRVLGFALGGMASVVLALALYVWVSFDARRIESELTRYLAENYNRTLLIEDGVSLTLWPWPTIKVGKASLSEAKRNTSFITLKQARLKLALEPLLSHKFVIQEVKVRGGSLKIARDAAGRWSFMDILQADDKKVYPLGIFKLENLDLADVTLSVVDAESEDGGGRSVELRDLQLISGPLHAASTGVIHAQAKLVAPNPAIDGAIVLDSRYQLVTGYAGRLDETTLRFNGRVGDVTGAESYFKINALTWIERGTAWQLEKALLSLDGNLGKRTLQASIDLPKLNWARQTPRGDLLTAHVVLQGTDDKFELHTEARGIVPATGGFSSNRVRSKWQIKSGLAGLEGELNSPVRVDWHAGLFEWERLTGQFMLSHPRLNATTARGVIDGTASWRSGGDKKNNGGVLKLTAHFDKDDMRLNAQVSRLFPLSAQFDLTSARFDTSRFMAASAPSVAEPIALPVAFLKNAELDGNINFRALNLNGLKLDALVIPIELSEGKFESTAHSVSLYGGTIKGSLAFDSDGNSLVNRETFQNIDLRSLAHDTGGNLLIAGRATGNFELAAKGADTTELMKSASGLMRIKLTQTSLNGIDIGQSLHEFRAAYKAGQTAARTPRAKELTELAEVSGNVGLREGKLFTQTLAGHNQWLRLGFNGELDLQQKNVDLTARAVVSSLVPKTPSSDLAELRGKPVSLRIKGTLAQPGITLDALPEVTKAMALPGKAPVQAASQDAVKDAKASAPAPTPKTPAPAKSVLSQTVAKPNKTAP